MRNLRPIAYLLLVLLLAAIAAGLYIYPRIPAIAVQQAEDMLHEYGVRSIDLEGPRAGLARLQVDRLDLKGQVDSVAVDARAQGVDLHYNWRLLLDGRFGELDIDRLTLVVDQLPASGEASGSPLVIDQLLPSSFLPLIPLQSVRIRHLEVDYRAPGARPVTAVGTVSITGAELALEMAGDYADSQFRSQLRTGDNTSPVSLDLSLDHAGSKLLTLGTQLTRGSADLWQWNTTGSLDWAVALAWARGPGAAELALDMSSLAELALQGSSTFEAQLQHPNTLFTPGTQGTQWLRQFSAGLQLDNELSDIDYPPVFDSLQGKLPVAVSLADGRWSLAIEPSLLTAGVFATQLPLAPESRSWLGWQALVPLRLDSSERITAVYDQSDTWVAQIKDLTLALGDNRSQLLLNDLQLDATVATAQERDINVTVTASLASRLRKTQLPQLELALEHSGPLERGKLELAIVDTAESMRLLIAGSGNAATGQGQYSLQASSLDLPYASSEITALLRKFDLLQKDLEIISGNFKLDSVIASRGFSPADWQVKSNVIASGISGSLDEYAFTGISLAADWQGVEKWQTLAPVEFSVDKLAAGFEITDLRASITLPEATPVTQPVLSIDTFTATLFGGRVYLPEATTWDFSAASNHLTLKAERWQLAELVALQQDQQINAQGNLEGELPLTLRDGRIIIDKGYLKARAPGGNIRYVPDEASQALASSSPELGLAIDLLRDFRYDVLSSDVQLDEEGNLLLGLSLGGRNPDQFDGRQVNFNINLEQNIDPLLQSLRLNDTLLENIEKRLE